jgi:aminoglycoside 6'-N-acetyltransferase
VDEAMDPAVRPVLRGRRVTLRPVTAADAPHLVQILATPEVARWWPAMDLERVRAELIEADDAVAFAIEADEQVVGLIQYGEETDPDYRYAGIDLFLHPGWHHRGLGADAIRTLARHLFDNLGHHRIVIDPAAANERAIRTYERVGFKAVGVMRNYERDRDGGGWHDGLLMDMLPEDLTPDPEDAGSS